jgi:hypothetical protein
MTGVADISDLIIMRSLHNVHEMNACRADQVCLSVHMPAWFNLSTAEQIWIKFGMGIMPLGPTLKSYFYFPTISSTNMTDKLTCEVGLRLVPLNIGSYNNVR